MDAEIKGVEVDECVGLGGHGASGTMERWTVEAARDEHIGIDRRGSRCGSRKNDERGDPIEWEFDLVKSGPRIVDPFGCFLESVR